MKKQTFIGILSVTGLLLSFASCTYKGECKCGSVTVEGEYDNKDDYKDAKAACELLDCTWKKKL